MYQSPIEIITKKMRTQFEDNVFKAIQDYGIVVDKEELIKALQYDRDQYEIGYADGMLAQKDEWISVEERLPDEQGRFLIVDKEGQMNTAFYTPRFGWFSHFRIKNITHWMPLPEAPKMKGGESNV